jgi:hypothetical protein
MKFIKLLLASFLAIPFDLQVNAQIDCCGLAVGTVIQSPSVNTFAPRSQNFGSRTPSFNSRSSSPLFKSPVLSTAKFSNSNGGRIQNPDRSFSKQPNQGVFSSGKQGFQANRVSSSNFVSNAKRRYCAKKAGVAQPVSSNSAPSRQSTPIAPSRQSIPSAPSLQSIPSAPVVYYMERPIKSIRVSSVPDIERWEGSLRKNMALNGRNKGKVDELLNRIRNHYGDQSIEAKDYSANGKGYVPSDSTRNLAESRIERTVKSMAVFFEKSGNPEMDPSKSAGGDGFLKGKLSFVNTELDKLGKPRVSLEELKQVISLQMTGLASPVAVIDHFQAPKTPVEEAPAEERGLDENLVKDRVKVRYIAFAGWLVDNEKKFPSLDPEVDGKTMETFDLVNTELRGIGKFESMTIFREKTIAYLEDLQDGQIRKPLPPLVEKNTLAELGGNSNKSGKESPSKLIEKRFGDPFADRTSVSSHLPLYSGRALPGKAWGSATPVTRVNPSRGDIRTGTSRSFMTPSRASLPGKSWNSSGTVNQNGQSMRIIRSVLNNLPGTPI